jgi:hypothetical protein
MPRRATDADGGYAWLMVLERQVPISTARPLDLNHRDPFVRLHCADGAQLVDVSPMPRCPDGESPLAARDVVAGLAADDPYTRRLCRSRRYLWDHMDGKGRSAFAASFRECGLETDVARIARRAS